MNTGDIYKEYGKFERYNNISLINTTFLDVKNRLIEAGHINHLSIYGALSNDGKLYPMRFEIFSKRLFNRYDIKNIRQFINTIKPIGYNIGIYAYGTVYPVITESEIKRCR